MKVVEYNRHWSLNGSEKIKKEIDFLLIDYPYSFPYADNNKDIRLIPPLNYINDLLLSGGDNGGMSPGTTWKGFKLSIEEYENLVKKLLSNDFNKLKGSHPYAPNKLILDKELNEKYPDKEKWEKYQILKYKGVHQFIEFYGDFEPMLYINNSAIGKIEIFGTANGPRYFGKLKTDKNIFSFFNNKAIDAKKTEIINEWIEYEDNFNVINWYLFDDKNSFYVSDSWDRKSEIIKIYLSENNFVSFITDFKEIKPNK